MITLPVMAGCLVAILLSDAVRPPHRAAASRNDPTDDPRDRTAGSRHWRRVCGLLALLASSIVLGPLPTAGIALAIASRPRIRLHLAARASRRAVDAALPEAIEMLILVVHAGMTPHQAVVMLAERAPRPIQPAFAEVRRRITRGAPLADAIGALPEVLGPGAATVADTLAMAERHGTPIGHALEQLSLDVRERRRRRAEAEARKLPIRMSFPLVACTLPSFVLMAIVPAVMAALASLDDTGL